MTIVIYLLGVSWGLSPFLLVWVIIRMRHKTAELPGLTRTLSASWQEKARLEKDLTAARMEIQALEKKVAAFGDGLLKMREKAAQLPDLANRLTASEEQRTRLGNELSAAGIEIEALEKCVAAFGKRLLKDNVKFIGAKVTANNYATSKKSFEGVFDFCEKNGYSVPAGEQQAIVAELKQDFEEEVRKQWNKEEQARIKRQIREEQKLEAERQRELQRIENEELAIQTALQKAMQKAADEHDVEVQRLKAKLAEAQGRLERAKSMAELTKAGFVYVISNVGSFGTNIFKVGMTRRLEPIDRVRELGDASVPFPYDVHMMISADDAPGLETALHRELHKVRINRVNPRREFFRTDINTLARLVEKYHGKVDYVAEPEALEYNESNNMSEADFDYVSEQLGRFEEDEEGYRGPISEQPLKSGLPSTANTGNDAKSPTGNGAAMLSVSDGGRVRPPAMESGPREQKRSLACPRCKGTIYVSSLVNGENACPYCQAKFKIRKEGR